MKKPTQLNREEIFQKQQLKTHPAQQSYYVFYSTWLGGMVTDPDLMTVPVDDHLVHRGDGVFEALKWNQGKVYLLDPHLKRLRASAERIGLEVPWSNVDIQTIIQACVDLGLEKNPKLKMAMVRLFVSRGPGHFSTNPYDSVGSQLYVMLTKLTQPLEEKYLSGASLGKSVITPKDSNWAPYKTCNYLPNVLMKRESVDRGFDFVVGFDSKGFMTESSTENIIIVSQRNELLKPMKDFILQGTTMNRALQIANSQLLGSLLDRVQEENITEEMLRTAKEIMVAGTTWDILPITKFEGQKVGTGQVGPVAKKLRELILQDQASS